MTWGFSIHAKRRIQIFVDDPSFEVAVVSTFNYQFSNAENTLLSGPLPRDERIAGLAIDEDQDGKGIGLLRGVHRIESVLSKVKKIFNVIELLISSCNLLLREFPLSKIVNVLRFHAFKALFLSGGILHELMTAGRDLKILKSAFRKFKPEIVFLQTTLYPAYLAYFLPSSVSMVITFWNGDLTWWAKWRGIERVFKRELVAFGVRRAKAITVNSKVAFSACLDYGAEPQKIHTIRYPGVDLKRFRPEPKDVARRNLGIPFEKVVFCPRGIGAYLNSDIIVESAAKVIRRFPNTLFLFTSGNGNQMEWTRHQDRGRELGVEANLRWDGQVPWDAMGLYYSVSDVMVSVSSNDSLPNCMIEAMACGTPVIMGDIASIREWVTDGFNGYLVPPRDAAALSEKIIEVLEGSNRAMGTFVSRNLDLVNREMDSRKKGEEIKALVHHVAGHVS